MVRPFSTELKWLSNYNHQERGCPAFLNKVFFVDCPTIIYVLITNEWVALQRQLVLCLCVAYLIPGLPQNSRSPPSTTLKSRETSNRFHPAANLENPFANKSGPRVLRSLG